MLRKFIIKDICGGMSSEERDAQFKPLVKSHTESGGELHPTVKPVRMIVDAIKDVSGRGEIVLDLFGGSGSTLIAAEKTGRRAFLCELDPIYCDRILRRWEVWAKDDAERLVCGWPAAPAEAAA